MSVPATSATSGDPYAGFVLGMAVGDALGLPREGLSRRRAARLFGLPPLRHRLILGRGMVSDDTEHMRMTAQALLAEPGDSSRFANRLAWKLRWWLLWLPAGTGLATARAIVRLWLGFGPDRSGVASAGNGPAMRAGIIGLCLYRDDDPLNQFIRAATRITHTDERAETGARLIALASREAIRTAGSPIDAQQFLQACRDQSPGPEWQSALESISQGLAAGETASQFADRQRWDRGVSGYIVPTVAAVLFCWLRWPGEFRQPVEQVIALGGDTDSTAAILGGLAGATCGPEAIPREWLTRLIEWPYSVEWMRSVLAADLRRRFGPDRIQSAAPRRGLLRDVVPRFLNGLALLGRNLLFLGIVLAHGFRRLLPPY